MMASSRNKPIFFQQKFVSYKNPLQKRENNQYNFYNIIQPSMPMQDKWIPSLLLVVLVV